ncbi:unnamed protein product [Owenia fusiformis]|uniref:Uncharacterized protein n=1 Tax=Owenia fusiformis TaxID=6347 RepID=A0A8J1USU5_OWEFU|nr:unnamed protein product [Owenia fusiformis]
MDLIDLIRMILDMVGLDLFEMPQPVWTVGRQRDGMSPRYHNIVRRIGSALPIEGAKRIHIQKSLVGYKQEPKAIAERCPNLGDLSWVMKYNGDSCIVVKGTEFDRDDSSSFGDDTLLNEEPLRCSTPLNQTTDSTVYHTPDVKAMEKISQLEDELAKMRAQIASIVMAQEQSTVTPSVADNSHIGAAGPTVPPPPPAPPMGGPPPPPPPPPPMLALPTKSINDIIRENKAKSGGAAGSSNTKPQASLPNMSDVLKGLGKVKLNRVKRSPGGTPLRQKPLISDSSDPASMIAAALKKRFASQRRLATPPSTPEQDKENSANGFSPLASPTHIAVKSAMPDNPVVPGPHLLKNRRKSGSKRLSGGLSPSKRRSLTTVKENQCASPLSTVNQNTIVPN